MEVTLTREETGELLRRQNLKNQEGGRVDRESAGHKASSMKDRTPGEEAPGLGRRRAEGLAPRRRGRRVG